MGRALEIIEKKLLMTIVYFQLKFFQPIRKNPAYSDKTTNYAIEFIKVNLYCLWASSATSYTRS